MSRPRVNLYLDLLAFLSLFATILTGLVLRLALPPGSGRAGAGSADRPITTLWGWTRHEWGDLHYVASLVLLGILGLHLWLHRDWIRSMMNREANRDSGKFFALGLVASAALLAVGLSPLFTPTISQTRGELLEQRDTPLEPAICHLEGQALSAEEVGQLTGLPVTRLREAAGGQTLSPSRVRELVAEHYAAPASAPTGEMLYERHCRGCHASPPRGPAPGPRALEQLRHAPPAGAHEVMGGLKDEELQKISNYLQKP
jgi:mono/diheme cytochrome c family protein